MDCNKCSRIIVILVLNSKFVLVSLKKKKKHFNYIHTKSNMIYNHLISYNSSIPLFMKKELIIIGHKSTYTKMLR